MLQFISLLNKELYLKFGREKTYGHLACTLQGEKLASGEFLLYSPPTRAVSKKYFVTY
jgi:hypothetical protein